MLGRNKSTIKKGKETLAIKQEDVNQSIHMNHYANGFVQGLDLNRMTYSHTAQSDYLTSNKTEQPQPQQMTPPVNSLLGGIQDFSENTTPEPKEQSDWSKQDLLNKLKGLDGAFESAETNINIQLSEELDHPVEEQHLQFAQFDMDDGYLGGDTESDLLAEEQSLEPFTLDDQVLISDDLELVYDEQVVSVEESKTSSVFAIPEEEALEIEAMVDLLEENQLAQEELESPEVVVTEDLLIAQEIEDQEEDEYDYFSDLEEELIENKKDDIIFEEYSYLYEFFEEKNINISLADNSFIKFLSEKNEEYPEKYNLEDYRMLLLNNAAIELLESTIETGEVTDTKQSEELQKFICLTSIDSEVTNRTLKQLIKRYKKQKKLKDIEPLIDQICEKEDKILFGLYNA